MSSTTRHRAYAWEDQSPTRIAGATRGGLDVLRAIGDAELPLPPALCTLDISPVEAEPGRACFALTPSEFHLNPFGLVHGGVLSALMDTAMGCAVHSLLPAGSSYVTAELGIRFLRPASVRTGTLTCVGEVVHPGRSTMVVQAHVTDGSGTAIATGGATCLVRELS